MAPHDKVARLNGPEISDNVRYVIMNCNCVCFDVDSTMLTTEAIDELARYAGCLDDVRALTHKAMSGTLSFREALTQRLNIINPSQKLVSDMLKNVPCHTTLGFREVVKELFRRGVDVHLVSGGFEQLIAPVAQSCGIPVSNIHANKILFDEEGNYAGFDKTKFTSASMGKARCLEYLKEKFDYKHMIMVGDGMTDAEAKPPADIFIGFGGNIMRAAVEEASDWWITSFYSILEVLQSPKSKK